VRIGRWVVVGALLGLSCSSLRTGSPDQGSGGQGGAAAGSSGAAGTGVAGTTGNGGGGAPGGTGGGGTRGTAGTSGTAGTGGTAFEPDGLIGFWRFNEGTSTTVADSSGNGQLLMLSTGGAWSTMGHEGATIAFDGASDLASVVPVTGQPLFDFPTTQLTMSAWVRPTAAAASRAFASVVARTHEDYAFQDFWLGLADGKPACSIHSPLQETAAAPAALTTTAWTHIACTYNPDGDIIIYVNGAAAGTYHSNEYLGPIPTAILVGASETMQPAVRAQFFPGSIDDVRIYKRALTPSEVGAIVR
jgi:hypothetical protein